jgi:hypothetical protein
VNDEKSIISIQAEKDHGLKDEDNNVPKNKVNK